MNDVFKFHQLPLVDHAQENGGGSSRVHPLALHTGGAVAQAVNQLLGNFIGLLGDDLKLDGGLSAAQNAIGYVAAEEAVQDAQDDGLDLVTIDKVGDTCHHAVHQEGEGEEVEFR